MGANAFRFLLTRERLCCANGIVAYGIPVSASCLIIILLIILILIILILIAVTAVTTSSN